MIATLNKYRLVDIEVELFKKRDFGFIVDSNGKLHVKQREALCILTDDETEEFGYGGAAGGAKSWTGCSWLTFMCQAYPGTKWFIAREELTRLMGSTYITLQKVFKAYGLKRKDWKLNGKYNYIEFTNGSRIDFLDTKFQPRDLQYERFGSLEYTGGWIEEGGEVHVGAYDTLKTRIGRHMNDQYKLLGKLLVTLNPKKNWCHTTFWKPFKAKLLPPKIKFMQALATDNPHVESGYIEKLRSISDKVRKQRLLYGNFDYDDDDNALMDYDSITDIFTNESVERGEKYITADVARFGKDKSVIMVWAGWCVIDIIVLEKKKTTEVAAFIRELAFKYNIPMSRIVADEDGVGGGVVDILGCKGFVNGSSPLVEPETKEAHHTSKIKPNYKNLRSQCYYRLAIRVNDRKIYVKCELFDIREMIEEELEQIKKKEVDNDKSLQVVPKLEMKELLGRSPDFADSIMMREYFELKPAKKPQDLAKKLKGWM